MAVETLGADSGGGAAAGPTTLTRDRIYRALDRRPAAAALLFGLLTLGVSIAQLGRVRGYFDANRNQHVQMIFSGSELGQFPWWDAQVSPTDPEEPIVAYRDELPAVQRTTFVFGESLFYYYIPLLFKPLGLERPFVGLAIFLGLLTGVAAAQALFLGIRDRTAEIVTLYVAVAFAWLWTLPGINLVSVYFQHLVAPLWLFSITAQAVRWSRSGDGWRGVLHVVALSVGLALSVLVRTSVMLAVVSGLVFILAVSVFSEPAAGRRRSVLVIRAVLLVLAIFGVIRGVAATLGNRVLSRAPENGTAVREGGHVVWHTVFCALGVLDDRRYPFEWSDYAAQTFATSLRPGVIPYSPEYEAVLREYIVDTVRSDPYLLWRFLELQASFQIGRFGAALAVLLALLAFRRHFDCREVVAIAAFLVATLGTWPIQLISIPHEVYLFQIHIGEWCALWMGVWILARRLMREQDAQ